MPQIPAFPWWRPRRTDLLALAVWAASRVVMLAISLAVLASQSGPSWLSLWQRWDWDRYLTIAEYGYTSGKGPAYDSDIVAFFPGYPAVLRAVHFVVRNWVVSGLLISVIAGAVACIALARLTEFEWRARGERAGGTPGRAAVIAVLLLVCAPAAVFLAAGYTESLFLALGIPAWLAARQRRWVLAGVLTALACAVRIDGVFEAAGIGVMFLLGRPKAHDWARSPALLLPLVAVGGYFAYLKDITGDWLAWFSAEAQGWARRLTNPVTAFRNSWENAFGSGGLAGAGRFGRGGGRGPGGQRFGTGRGGFGGGTGGGGTGGGGAGGGGRPGGAGARNGFGPGTAAGAGGGPGGAGGPGRTGGTGGTGGAAGGRFGGSPVGRLGGVGPFDAWPFRLDILVVLAGLAFMGWAVFRRRWAELVYVGVAVISLATSTYYMSVAREALLWWPLFIALAIWLSRRRWLAGVSLLVSGALMVGISWLFLTGSWAG